MIITAEVLDRPKLTFAPNNNSIITPPPEQECLKRATSPSATLSDCKKLRSSSTQIATFPKVPNADSKRQVSTATLQLRSPENANDVDSLRCDPYVVCAKLNAPNIRVEHKSGSQKRSTSPPAKECRKETAEEWLERLHGQRFPPKQVSFLSSKSKVGDQRASSAKDKIIGNKSESKLPLDCREPASGEQNDSSRTSKNDKKVSVLDIIINKRKASNSGDVDNKLNSVNGLKNDNLSGSTADNGFKTSHCFLHPKKGDVSSNVIKDLKVNEREGLSKNSTSIVITTNKSNDSNNNKNNIASAKRHKANESFDKEPTTFRSRDVLSASVPPNLRKQARSVAQNTKIKSPTELGNHDVSGPNLEKKEAQEPEPRKNSLSEAWWRLRRSSTADSKRDSLGCKRCSISGCTSKRPSICALQENKTFIEKLKSRNSSLVGEDFRTRSNSLTNFVNIRQGNQKVSKNKNGTGATKKKTHAKNVGTTGSSCAELGSAKKKPSSARKAIKAPKEGWKKVGTKRMGKTTTTTEVRTFKRGDRWYKETKVTTVVEHKTGTNTSTKTTTQELPGPPNDGTSSSASSRSPSPARATSKRSASGGLLSKLKDKVTGGSSSSSSDDEDEMDEKLAKLMLAKVNEKRALHGVKALTLSDTLNQQAKDWAKHLAAQDRMEHKNAPNKGENIYKLSSNAPITWKFRMQADPVAHWYEEEKLHKYGQEPSAGKLDSGHFSQLVWKDTKQFGFGSERSASGLSVYFVAFFNPKGNWKGEFTDQVPPVGGFPKSGRFSSVTSKLQQTAFNASSSSSSDEEEDFAAAVLSAHNQYRLKHGVPPLTLSKKLNKTAEEWAKIISKRDRLEHRPNNQYGENIYAKWNSRPIQSLSGKEPVDSWYSEVKNHVFGKEPPSLATGHFTQVVWEDSKELGVGVAKNKNSGKIFVVCNYNPPGNIMGSFAAKVPKAKS